MQLAQQPQKKQEVRRSLNLFGTRHNESKKAVAVQNKGEAAKPSDVIKP